MAHKKKGRVVYDFLDKYSFICEMYEKEKDAIRELVLHFYLFDNSIEVLDVHQGKRLLRRVQCPTVKLENLEIGNVVNVFSKLLLIKDACVHTANTMLKGYERTFAMIKPLPQHMYGTVLSFIMNSGFRIVRMKNGRLTKEVAVDMFDHLNGIANFALIIDYVTSGEVIGLELEAKDAVRRWRAALGATDPKVAEPGTLRRLLGESMLKNVAHGAVTLESAQKDMNRFFGWENGVPRIPFIATFENCTCCIIKPHAVLERSVGSIIELIATSKNFYISSMAMFSLSVTNAREFYEVYKGVLAEYEQMCIHLSEGKFVVLEVKSTDPSLNVVCEFRKWCGNYDPDVSRQLYPNSIRAQYGKDIVHNAVHCTDLQEEGPIEVEYFFRLIANTEKE